MLVFLAFYGRVMATKLFIFAIAALASASVLAEENYVPKFAGRARVPSTKALVRPVAMVAPSDSSAGVLDASTCPRPPYPLVSLRNDETGTSTLQLSIGPTGEVIDGKVIRSSGFRNLDEAALRSVRNCVYRPGGVNGVPVTSFYTMQYKWSLD